MNSMLQAWIETWILNWLAAPVAAFPEGAFAGFRPAVATAGGTGRLASFPIASVAQNLLCHTAWWRRAAGVLLFERSGGPSRP